MSSKSGCGKHIGLIKYSATVDQWIILLSVLVLIDTFYRVLRIPGFQDEKRNQWNKSIGYLTLLGSVPIHAVECDPRTGIPNEGVVFV